MLWALCVCVAHPATRISAPPNAIARKTVSRSMPSSPASPAFHVRLQARRVNLKRTCRESTESTFTECEPGGARVEDLLRLLAMCPVRIRRHRGLLDQADGGARPVRGARPR